MSAGHSPIFFIHVMKTAGTTFFFHLRAHFGFTWVFPGALQTERPLQRGGKLVYFELETLQSLPPVRLMGYKAFAGHYPYVTSEMLGFDTTRLTILRDPVERTISYLRHAKEYQAEFRDASAEQIYDHDETFRRFIQNHQTKVFSMNRDDELRSVLDIVDMDESRLDVARANLEKVDLLGLQEHFDEFMDEAELRFGIERQPEVSSQRVGSVELVIADSLRERIAEDNSIDIALYQHAVELHRSRRSSATPSPTPIRVGSAGPTDARAPQVAPGPEGRPDGRDLFFHMHITRTACQSVNRDIRRTFADEAIYPFPDGLQVNGRLVPRTDIQHLLGLPRDLLADVDIISGHFPYVVSQLLGAPRRTIVVVRDPVDRIIDQLRHRIANNPPDAARTIEEVYDDVEFFQTRLLNHQVKQFAMTQSDPLEIYLDHIDIDGPRLEIAKENLRAVDVVGLSEDIEAIRAEMVRRFDWKMARPKPAPAELDAPAVPASLRRRIIEDNAADLEFYDFARKLVAERSMA